MHSSAQNLGQTWQEPGMGIPRSCLAKDQSDQEGWERDKPMATSVYVKPEYLLETSSNLSAIAIFPT